MAYTSLTSAVGAVGQRWKAAVYNLVIQAIQELQANIMDLRPQLRVYAPASVTNGSPVPYATVRRDTHTGWNSSTYKYTVPVSGLYALNVQWKCGATGVASNLALIDNATGNAIFTGPNSSGLAYNGFTLTGVVDLTATQVVYMKEVTNSYTPYNDATGSGGTGSNYFHLTYIGPST